MSDYTIMGRLTPKMYETFRTNLALRQQHSGKTLYQMLHNQQRKVDTRPIVLFKEELESEIQTKLQQQGGLTEEESEIADLTFAFDNSKMLELLNLRAAALKASKFEAAEQISRRLTEEKNRSFDRLVRPNSFFCTFRHETG